MSGRLGFVGLRLAGASALVSLGGIAGMFLGWQVLQPERDRVLLRLVEDLDARAEMGARGVEALQRASTRLEGMAKVTNEARLDAAQRRANELSLLAASGPVPSSYAPRPGELLGQVWPESDRLSGLNSGAGTTTLSVARPALMAALSAAPGSERAPLLARTAAGVFSVAPGPQAGPRAVAFVPLPSLTVPPNLAPEMMALGNLASTESVPGALFRPEVYLAGFGVICALLGFLWAHGRVSRPLIQTLEAARAFVHGDGGARADDARGGAEAREVARAVNGLIERAVRLESKGRAAREEDIQAAAVAIEVLGRGDLGARTPPLGAPFTPISSALERARRDLFTRVARLHEVSRAVAQDAVTMAPSAGNLAAATESQKAALERLADNLQEAEKLVEGARDRLHGALRSLAASSADQRRATHELKSTVGLVARRMGDLGAATARVKGLADSAQSIESALALLGTWAASSSKDEAERGSQAVGEARAALLGLRTELAEVSYELSQVGERLEGLVSAQRDAPPDPTAAVSAPLCESASGLVQASELLGRGLTGWLRSTRVSGKEATSVARAAENTAGRLDALTEAFSELRVGEAFEKVLLERLEQARAEVEAAGGEGLTREGAAMVAEVEASAEAAKLRVGQLLRATEATLEVLRP